MRFEQGGCFVSNRVACFSRSRATHQNPRPQPHTLIMHTPQHSYIPAFVSFISGSACFHHEYRASQSSSPMASRPSFSVLWSPHEGDKFVAGSTTLSLYKIVSDEESKSSVASSENPTSSTDGAGNAHRRGRTPWRSGESFELLDSISSNFHANCLAWGLKKGDPNLMASGLQSGKVSTHFSCFC